jgi:hypothetical protein
VGRIEAGQSSTRRGEPSPRRQAFGIQGFLVLAGRIAMW